MDININIATRDGATVVAVSGEVDLQTAPRLAEALESCPGGRVVVDLSDVDFLDSSGLGALVTGNRHLTEAGGSLRLVRPRPSVDKVLTISRLTDVIEAFDSVDAALA